MIMELLLIIICEIIVLLAILIVYCADYTNSYIHCHKPTEPCYERTKVITSYCPKSYEIPKEEICKHYSELGKKKVPKEFEDD